MSRTLKRMPFHCLRGMRHIAYRKNEIAAIQEFFDNDINNFSNRLRGFKTRIPNPWDDYLVSSYREIPKQFHFGDHRRKYVLNKKRNNKNTFAFFPEDFEMQKADQNVYNQRNDY